MGVHTLENDRVCNEVTPRLTSWIRILEGTFLSQDETGSMYGPFFVMLLAPDPPATLAGG